MSKVHLLPQEVISKIAAGEVIDRPSSVIKETVENALDAGATSIEISLKDGGKTLIQMKDNGHGIEQEDLEKIFLRHATSKIKTSDDLFDIHSLGFRGEALYSVAAIADINLKSKTLNQDSGWEVHMRGGKQLTLKPCTFGAAGTELTVQELFYNTPVRKKFLKSNSAEIHQVLNTFIPYTLLHKDCRFKLSHQEKTLIDLAPADNLTERISDVLNLDKTHLLEVNQDFPSRKCTIQLVLGDINVKRTRRDMQFIFVNGRPVQNKNISYHLNQIYRLIMAPDEFGFFCIYISLPADDIDVNIHPTKREVKIKDETPLCSLIRRMAEAALMSGGKIRHVQDKNDKTSSHTVNHSLKQGHSRSDSFEHASPAAEYEPSLFTNTKDDYAYPKNQQASAGNFFLPDQELFEKAQDNSIQSKLENASYIGQFMQKFLLFESGNSLLIMDQHAAQERMNYELFIQQMNNSSIEIQNLLAPVSIKLSPTEMVVWEEVKNNLEDIGFSSNQWDEQTIAVHSHPQLITEIEQSVRNLLSGDKIEKSDHDTIAMRACKASIRAGERVTKEKAEFLREQLLQCLDPFTCPHGRPTILELTENFLDKQFLRT